MRGVTTPAVSPKNDIESPVAILDCSEMQKHIHICFWIRVKMQKVLHSIKYLKDTCMFVRDVMIHSTHDSIHDFIWSKCYLLL